MTSDRAPYLGWCITDPETGEIRLWPAEAYGPLPDAPDERPPALY